MKALSPKREGKDFPDVPVNKKKNPKKPKTNVLILFYGLVRLQKQTKITRHLCRPKRHVGPPGKCLVCQMVSSTLPATIHLQLFCISSSGTWQPYTHI